MGRMGQQAPHDFLSRRAEQPAGAPGARSQPHARSAAPFGAYVIESVGTQDIFVLESAVRSLAARTLEPNAFGGADFLLAACRHMPDGAAPDFLTVWTEAHAAGQRQLVALFPMQKGRFPLSGNIVRGWNHPFSALGTPLLDCDHAVPALTALMQTLGSDPQGGSALCLSRTMLDGPIAKAVTEAAGNLDLNIDILSRELRAGLFLPPPEAEKTERRSKVRRRQRRRLEECGNLEFQVL